MKEAIELYAMLITAALPFAVAFSIGNLLVNSFLNMAFKGHVEF